LAAGLISFGPPIAPETDHANSAKPANPTTSAINRRRQ